MNQNQKAYDFIFIEEKWQKYWEENQTFAVQEDNNIPKEKRKYILDMFPYPSAAGLHVGHPEGYTATDIYCRFLRMNDYTVLHPMGFDSFGLPAETYAIQTHTHPRVTTEKNIENFRKQIKRLGFSYDWNREISTHRPEYYKWTQWIFSQLYKKGLAYEQKMPVWFCADLGTVLANEEVLSTPDGPRSERGNYRVERRPLRQWVLKITQYADRLLEDLEDLDWPESIKSMQRNWIGRSEGANVGFVVENTNEVLEVFTTRPDTLWGATYMVVAPEHAIVEKITSDDKKNDIKTYLQQSRLKSDLERTDLAKDKTGVFTGAYVINPVNKEKIPIWVSDYVLISYGTGAIMAVPAHDVRDWDFAKKFNIPIVQVVAKNKLQKEDYKLEKAYTNNTEGVLINSGDFTGIKASEAKEKIIVWLEEKKIGSRKVQYKLRDWIFSRQRYWGEPIPIIHTEDKRVYLVDESEYPLTLPEVQNYKPMGTGESPLATIDTWVSVVHEGQPARRETNTMPQWAGSCWYYLRYLDPHNTEEFVSREKIDYWMPVDLYLGGAEHAVLHLLYARFWHKVFFDLGLVNTKEPFKKLINQGMILGEDGNKMSKSLGNVINPDVIIREFGADSLRVYEMFMGPLQQEKPWSTKGLAGVKRFLNRVWNLTQKEVSHQDAPLLLQKELHKTLKKVTEDIHAFSFNTSIAQMMILLNEMQKHKQLYLQVFNPFVRILAPFAPHIAEELWEFLQMPAPVSLAQWPKYDEKLVIDDEVELVFQINGKVRSKHTCVRDMDKTQLENIARTNERIQKYIDGKKIKKVVIVPNKLVNFVI